MANTYFTTLIALAVCTLTPACDQLQIFGDDQPHVKESRAEKEANMKRSQDLLQKIQEAARQCTTIARKITYFDKRNRKVTHLYPFTPEETEKAREIFLTRAHAVMWDGTIHPSPPVLSYSFCFLDASGKELASISTDSVGWDSHVPPDGYYRYCARISMPDADRDFIGSAGDKEKMKKDAERFYEKAK